MSVFLDKSEKLASRLNRVAGLESYKFMAIRPRDIMSELDRLENKPTGAGIIIWQGGSAIPEASPPRVNSLYKLTLVENPNLRRNLPNQDEIAQLVIQATHDWDIADSADGSRKPNAFRTQFKLQKVQPSEVAAGIDLIFESITQLPKPAITLRP